ncbi:SMP-30/gluconolactonase/LRE family protein [Pseudorhodoferax sp.]|uniref:SMP-30/gluconolactonase/LRE family protein n=1 Tax=Pseudorhodoferax sp. TaxID=1993553 RepID=UPI002DD62F07|nr:SMP-30/gluconolactonase/LRE family protein [Pseudorhodoferax sp.]
MAVLAHLLPVVGDNLNRPESVIALADGRLYACDRACGVVRVGAAREAGVPVDWPAEEFVANGIALLADGSFLIANVGPRGGAWRLVAPGRLEPFLTEAQGVPQSSLNFLYPDHAGNVWLSLCTQHKPRQLAFRHDNADAAIGVVRPGGRMEIVASGLGFTNELRVDPSGRWLYVNETIARRLSRFEILAGPRLGPRQEVCRFGRGTWPDGLEFDAEGGIWLTSVVSNRLLQVTPDGHCQLHLEDCDDAAIDAAEAAFAADRFGFDEISTGRHFSLRNLSSLAFGGPDLRTVYLGSLFHTGVSVWRAPLAGHAPAHWRVGATVID